MTTPDDRLSVFRTGQAIPVALKSVEKELAALWRASAAEAAGTKGGAAAVTRACLWNLIVSTPGGAPFARAKRLIDEISPSLPARVLVMSVDRAAPATPIEALIEANWHAAAGGSRQIGSDEVTLKASGDTVDDLASVVRALVLPDIPVAAIWLGSAPQPGRPLDDELIAAATRVVVDGEGGTPALAATARLVNGAGRQRLGDHVDLTSLAWLRATPWRQMIASLFDPPVDSGETYAVSTVKISCSEADRATALLLVGWLASRLGWSRGAAAGAQGYTFAARGGGAVEVTLDASQSCPDVFGRVELTTPSGPYTVMRLGGSVVLETPEISRKQPRHIPTDAELWLAALGARGRDPLFRDALRIAAALVA